MEDLALVWFLSTSPPKRSFTDKIWLKTLLPCMCLELRGNRKACGERKNNA
jgi:hypothetical protein